MAIDDEGGLYANVHVGGVLRSDDDAETWQATALDIRADAHQVIAPAGHDGLLLAATSRGLAISRDRGDSWERWTPAASTRPTPEPSPSAGQQSCSRLRVDPAEKQDAALFRRSLDGDEPFAHCRDGLPDHFDGNIDTHMDS